MEVQVTEFYPVIVACTWCGQLHYSDESVKYDGTCFCCEEHRQIYAAATEYKEDLFTENDNGDT